MGAVLASVRPPVATAAKGRPTVASVYRTAEPAGETIGLCLAPGYSTRFHSVLQEQAQKITEINFPVCHPRV